MMIILKYYSNNEVSQDSTVGIAISYWLDDRGVKNSHFSMSFRPALGSTQLPIEWVPGAISPVIKWPGRETDHSQLVPRSRKRGSIHPLPYTPSRHSAYLVKYGNIFTFFLVITKNSYYNNEHEELRHKQFKIKLFYLE
jgi:hypothetical protein